MHKWFQPIFQLLQVEHELGVSTIARTIGAPVSSLHVYLNNQSYFVQDAKSKKWRLPLGGGDYPLREGEKEISPKVQAMIDDPVAELPNILKLIKVMETEIALMQRRTSFLRTMATNAVKRV